MDKFKIIKEIQKHHPGYGTEKGWSWYRGGMEDTGAWLWDAMVEENDDVLKAFLDKLNKMEEDRKKEAERWNSLSDEEQVMETRLEMIRQKQALLQMAKDQENYLMWGAKWGKSEQVGYFEKKLTQEEVDAANKAPDNFSWKKFSEDYDKRNHLDEPQPPDQGG